MKAMHHVQRARELTSSKNIVHLAMSFRIHGSKKYLEVAVLLEGVQTVPGVGRIKTTAYVIGKILDIRVTDPPSRWAPPPTPLPNEPLQLPGASYSLSGHAEQMKRTIHNQHLMAEVKANNTAIQEKWIGTKVHLQRIPPGLIGIFSASFPGQPAPVHGERFQPRMLSDIQTMRSNISNAWHQEGYEWRMLAFFAPVENWSFEHLLEKAARAGNMFSSIMGREVGLQRR